MAPVGARRTRAATWIRSFCVAAVAMLMSSTVWAARGQSTLIERWGIGMAVGGGVTGFTAKRPSELANVGGNWEARLSFGTRGPFAIEAAYIGAAQGMDALGVENDAVLVGNGVEADLRMNLLRDSAIVPYALAGIGWRHYEVSGNVSATSSVRETDNVLEVPVGAGVTYSFKPVFVDLRGVFRPTFDSDLLRGTTESDRGLHNWSTRVSVGWEL